LLRILSRESNNDKIYITEQIKLILNNPSKGYAIAKHKIPLLFLIFYCAIPKKYHIDYIPIYKKLSHACSGRKKEKKLDILLLIIIIIIYYKKSN